LTEVANQEQTSPAFKAALTGKNGAIERLKRHWLDYSEVAPEELRHAKTGLTMAELVTDIAAVVHAILTEQVWPAAEGDDSKKSLLDLVAYFGKEISSQDIEAIKGLSLPSLPSLTPPSGELPERLPEIPDSFKELFEHFRKRLGDADLSPDNEERALWSTLLGLGLSQEHRHQTPHADCRRHCLIFCSLHCHDELGNVIPC
jgi:hypothetical protein